MKLKITLTRHIRAGHKILLAAFITALLAPVKIQAQTDAADVQVFPSSNPQAEVHISISKTNPNNLVLSTNTYTTTYQQGVYTSTNGGASWTGSDSYPGIASGVSGDPSTAIDASGNMYVSTIASSGTGYDIIRSTDAGFTWSTPILTGTSTSFDKEMIAADNVPSSPFRNYVYAAWTDFGSPYKVKFNRSTDNGTSYTTPITLKTGWGQGTNVQTGPNGEVYVCWAFYSRGSAPADSINFVRSTNGGSSFTTLAGFGYSGIRGVSTLDFNGVRVNDFPAMAVDKSFSAYRGRIYITYAEVVGGKSVVQMRSSSNNGSTWSAPVTVSIGCATQAWQPWIAADDVNGNISIVYYAFDDPSTPYKTNTYVAYSKDGGATFTNLRVSDVPHIHAAVDNSIFAFGYAGDYLGITAYNSQVYPAWMDNRNGTWQVYVSRIDLNNTATKPADISIAGPVTVNSGQNLLYTAVNTITVPTTSTYTIASGAKVTMSAGTNIRLASGFTASSGSTFRAYIDNSCAHASTRLAIASGNQGYEPDAASDGMSMSLYPNPVASSTTIEYSLPVETVVNIGLYNDIGEKVADVLTNEVQSEGQQKVSVDASKLPRGMYVYTVQAGPKRYSGKFVKVE